MENLEQLRGFKRSEQPTDTELNFEEELRYGIRLNIVEDSIEYSVMVNTHPEEDRFLMVVSLFNRRFWIVDLKLLSIQRNLPELESFYELKRHRCTTAHLRRLRVPGVGPLDLHLPERAGAGAPVQPVQRPAVAAAAEEVRRPAGLAQPQDLPALQRERRLLHRRPRAGGGARQLRHPVRRHRPQRHPGDRPQVRQGLLKQEFQTLIKVLLCKRELASLFKSICPGFSGRHLSEKTVYYCLTPLLEEAKFTEFLLKDQGETYDSAKLILEDLRPEFVDCKLSFHGFCKFMFSDANSIINPRMTQVYQDMDRPLTEYYVHSSHNTYLVGNQLTSDSKAFRYLEDLYDGVRCVELDIHVRDT